MEMQEVEDRLLAWFGTQIPHADDLRVEGLDRDHFGHSAETLLMSLVWRDAQGDQRQDVALRLRPPSPGLLEPYDLVRQFEILRRLEGTAVRAPRALWLEGSGEVLGREFYVMERLPGTVYEMTLPDELTADPVRARRMSESMVEQIAAIHTVDLRATGLDAIGDGRDYLGRELDHWSSEIRRVQRGPLPAVERLESVVRALQPEPCPVVTLVHGDAKPGNYAFVGAEVSAVFDWEMAGIGDPLCDIGWAETVWALPGSITSLPGVPSSDELVASWEALTGIEAAHRPWYRAFQSFKIVAIELVGSYLFDQGHSDDLRLAYGAYAVRDLTRNALLDLGVDEELESGPVLPRKERMQQVREAAAR